MVKLGFHPASWVRKEGGYQAHLLRALREISETGWDGFEFHRGLVEMFGGKVGEFKKILNDLDLELSACYYAASYIYPEKRREEMDSAKEVLDFLAELDGPIFLMDGGAKRPEGNREDDLFKVAEAANQLGEMAESRGIQAVWHIHYGTLLEVPEVFYRFMELTDPELVGFCPDTAQLALGGFDLGDVFRSFVDRIKYVHFKDLGPDGRFVENGRGTIDFSKFWDILREHGYSGWIVVDLDYTDLEPRSASEICKRYLNEHLGLRGRRDRGDRGT